MEGKPSRGACDALPKVELHCHVEGTVRPTTVLELARKPGRPLPVDDPTELYRYSDKAALRREFEQEIARLAS